MSAVKKSRKQERKEQRQQKKARRNDYYTNRNKPGKLVLNPEAQDVVVGGKQTQKKKIVKETPFVDPSVQNAAKERRLQKNLQSEMKKRRKKQLVDANVEEDKNIKRLEKQLKLNKRKSKAVPKSFATDGLDYLLEVCESGVDHAALADHDMKLQDFDEDFALMANDAPDERPTGKRKKNTKDIKLTRKKSKLDSDDDIQSGHSDDDDEDDYSNDSEDEHEDLISMNLGEESGEEDDYVTKKTSKVNKKSKQKQKLIDKDDCSDNEDNDDSSDNEDNDDCSDNEDNDDCTDNEDNDNDVSEFGSNNSDDENEFDSEDENEFGSEDEDFISMNLGEESDEDNYSKKNNKNSKTVNHKSNGSEDSDIEEDKYPNKNTKKNKRKNSAANDAKDIIKTMKLDEDHNEQFLNKKTSKPKKTTNINDNNDVSKFGSNNSEDENEFGIEDEDFILMKLGEESDADNYSKKNNKNNKTLKKKLNGPDDSDIEEDIYSNKNTKKCKKKKNSIVNDEKDIIKTMKLDEDSNEELQNKKTSKKKKTLKKNTNINDEFDKHVLTLDDEKEDANRELYGKNKTNKLNNKKEIKINAKKQQKINKNIQLDDNDGKSEDNHANTKTNMKKDKKVYTNIQFDDSGDEEDFDDSDDQKDFNDGDSSSQSETENGTSGDEADNGNSGDEPDNVKIKNDAGTWEDIYGRIRDKQGNVVQKSESKYIPPAVRAKMEASFPEDKKRVEKLNKLKRQLKGLLNRLAESNMHNIANQIENIYMENSRNDMNDTLTTLILEAIISNVVSPERLLLEHVLLITVLHANVGTEVGAHFLQTVVKRFDELYLAEPAVEDKHMDNAVGIIAQLYNFKVFNSQLLYQILSRLSGRFTEKDVECILAILKAVGFTLRKDDPLALKDLILDLQKRASGASEDIKDNPRVRFMLDILLAIKNNNMNKIPNYDTSYSEHLKKISKGFIRKGNYVTQLNIALDDLLKAYERGKWWVVGSAWTGKVDDDSSRLKTKTGDSTYSQKLLDLARKQRMNTDTRRNIFCIIMSAEDYLDAFEKLLHLSLKNQQEREIIHVLLHCCLQEKKYNPYYSVLALKFCEHDRKFQMTIKCSIWDKVKTLTDCSAVQISNLAKLLTYLFLYKGLPISTLKMMNFGELDKVTLRFMRQILLGVLLSENEEQCKEVFEKVAQSDKLKMFRESIRLFIRHFLLRNLNSESVSEERRVLLEKRAKAVETILTVNDRRTRF